MSEPRIALQRWPFEPSVAHICEACDYLCAPGVTVCPKCRTVLGEFSRPVKIDPAAAAAMATAPFKPANPGQPLWDENPPARPAERTVNPQALLTRCPHCAGVFCITVDKV